MQYKNFSANAIKTINRFIERSSVDAFDKRNLGVMAKLLAQGQKFMLPRGGKMFDDNLKGLSGEKLRLPFPITILEFDEAELIPERNVGMTSAPKRIAILVEGDSKQLYQLFGYPKSVVDKVESEPSVLVQAISYMSEIEDWYPIMGAIVVPAEWDKKGDRDIPIDPDIPKGAALARGIPIATLPTIFGKVSDALGFKEATKNICKDTTGEMFAMLEFCEALTCTNVQVETTVQSTAKVNEKRVRQGKLPMYDFHYLSIKPPKETKVGSEVRYEVSDRNSPRQHLRRGHIRRLGNGQKVWVNACVVGSYGQIEKVYLY